MDSSALAAAAQFDDLIRGDTYAAFDRAAATSHRARGVDQVASARLPIAAAPDGVQAHAFRSRSDGVEHLALVKGPLADGALVRVHSECLTGDALGSLRCDCGAQLQAALGQIAASGNGALIYLRGHEGRGIGLANKIRAYHLQDLGMDTAEANLALGFPADARDYAVAADIIRALGVRSIRLLSNNPDKAAKLRASGLVVEEEIALSLPSNPHNAAYLATKREKFGHRIG